MSGDRLFAGPASNPDRYRLEEVVSQGLEGRLWRSSLPVDGHRFQVAVKEIHQRNVASLAEWLERWERQAELLRSLDHPSLVRVREVFQGAPAHLRGAAADEERSLFLVMNWADGHPFDVWASSRGRDERLSALAQVASAVDHLHSGVDTNGVAVLHRDIKPQNIIVDDGGRPRLVDFGFARLADGTDYTLVGSAHYMAPEIPLGVVPTPASDRYSFGCVAYSVLSGGPVQPADLALVRRTIDVLRGGGLPHELADHLAGLLEHQPGDRPGDLAPWRGVGGQPAPTGAAPVAAETDPAASTPGATELRRPGWLPPTTAEPVVSSPPQHVTGPPTLPTAAASTYSSAGPVSWPPQPPSSYGPGAPPPVAIPAGTTTLGPESFGGSGRQWSSAIGIGLAVAAVLIGVVAGAVWLTSRSEPTTTTTTTTTTTEAPAVVLPELVGRSRADAQAVLAQLGLKGAVEYVTAGHPGEEVVAVSQPTGTQLRKGAEVRLSVSNPRFSMPDLRGRTLDAARLQLQQAGHVPGYVSINPAGASSTARVVGQRPPPATAYDKDATVELEVEEPVRTLATTTTTTMPAPGVVLPPATVAP
ncbi:MAG: PASTA domain-containing protein [Microthrixaceae bacterium]|nr:PASTA domain-containing protein [Microthrixaceae bacterium]